MSASAKEVKRGKHRKVISAYEYGVRSDRMVVISDLHIGNHFAVAAKTFGFS